jgi:hypothetical protein
MSFGIRIAAQSLAVGGGKELILLYTGPGPFLTRHSGVFHLQHSSKQEISVALVYCVLSRIFFPRSHNSPTEVYRKLDTYTSELEWHQNG